MDGEGLSFRDKSWIEKLVDSMDLIKVEKITEKKERKMEYRYSSYSSTIRSRCHEEKST